MRSRSQIFLYFTILIILSFFYALNSEAAVNGVSGAAYLYPETSIYRAKISIDISQYGGEAPSGGLQYYYTRTRMNFASTGITSLSIDENEASISGTGSVNGTGGYTFTATVVDGSPDIFGIVILKPGGSVYYSAGPIAIAGGDLTVRGDHPPSANAGPDQTVRVTQTISLDGSKSSDVDGDPLTYRWSFASVPTGSAAVLTKPSAVKPAFTADKPGTYVIQLIVNDGTVDSAPDTVLITTENSIPVADAGPDQTVRVSQTVSLDGSKSSDVDGNLLTYHWTFAAVPPGSAAVLTDAFAVKPAFTADKPGTYVIQLIVNDGTMDSAPDTVLITTENSVPVADAGPDQTVRVSQTVSLDGSKSSDVDGDPLTYYWSFTSVPPGSAAVLTNPSAVKPSFAADRPGTYVIQLIVNDGIGDSLPDTVTISTENSKPVANAGNDQAVYAGDTVKLNGGISSDVDKDPLTYRWSFTSVPYGSSATLSDSTKIEPLFVADREGIFVVQLIVNDGKVDSEPDTVTITVSSYMVTVPNVVAMSQAAAESAVISAELTVGAVTSDYSNTMPTGNVISQNPLAGTRVSQGTPVSLVVSLGPPGPLNKPPEIVSTPVTGGIEGQAYTYQTAATDPDGDSLVYSLITAPAGMSIDPVTGLIKWTPSGAQVGSQNVMFRVTDKGGLFAEQSFVVTVVSGQATNHAPTIISAGITPQWTQLTPTGSAPSPRTNSRSGYDAANDRLIVFGGERFDGQKLNEVWVLVNATGVAGTPSWVQLRPTGGLPPARQLGAAAYDPTANRLIIYGGCTGNCGTMLNDVWVLTNANGLGGTPEWMQLPSGVAKSTAGFAYDPISNRLMVFGGLTDAGPYSDQNAIRVLVDANGIGEPRWIDLKPTGTLPPPRSELVNVAYDSITNRLMVFGGFRWGSTEYNDTWVLTNANGLGGTPEWQQLSPSGSIPSERSSLPISYDPNSNRLIIFGGLNQTSEKVTYNDSWVLTQANGVGGTPQWLKLDPTGPFPTARRGYASAYDPSTNRLVMALGENDDYSSGHNVSTIYSDAWVLSNASGLCTVGQTCTFKANASDPDVGDVMTYSLTGAPAGMTIDSAKGAITWMPEVAQIGNHAVTVRVADRGGLFTTQSFTATVAPVAVPNLVGLAPEWAESFITSADLIHGTKTSQGGAITLNFDSLPSRQGWSYWVSGSGAPTEDMLFRVSGGVLYQDTRGIGERIAGYAIRDNVHSRLPLSITVRARVTAEEGGTAINHYGFDFSAWPGTDLFDVGLGTGAIAVTQALPTSHEIVPFDNTSFHDYRLDARPGSGYDFSVDGTLLRSGTRLIWPKPTYRIFLGDGTEGPNARAEIASFTFTQPLVVGQNPLPGTLVSNKTAIDLTIVEGPATETVPSLTGFAQAQASAVLSVANLVVGAVTSAPSGTVPVGQVIDQSPLPGIHVPKSTPVNLVLSTGPPASNQPPSIASSAILNATVGQGYAYQVSASDPNTGDTLTYSLPSAPAGMTIDATTGLISWTSSLMQIGSYPITIRVTDPWGLFVEQTYTLSVTNNTIPVANAGTDQTVYANETVTLDGSKSSDADGDPLTYQWSIVTRPTGSAATLSNPTTVNPTFVADKSGTYVLQLIVNDGKVDSDPDTVAISTENSKPVANAGTDQTVYANETVTLDGSKSSDADGDPLTFQWSFSARPAGSAATLSDPAAVKPTFVADKPGAYMLQLIVNDGKMDSAPDTVMISTENSKPVADAGADQTVLVNQTVTLDGSKSSDVDGDPLTYQWSFVTRPTGSTATLSNPATVNPTFIADKPGAYVLQLIVKDGKVNSVPDTVTINTENSKPVANAGVDQTGYTGDAVNLDGKASSDVDGDSLTYRWSFTSRPSGSSAALSNPGIVNPNFTADLEGIYVIQLIVNDGKVDSAPDTATITVSVKMVTVPNLLGIAQSPAQSAILAAELKVGAVANTYSSTVPAGMVISQNPAAGTSVTRGSAVSFVVSLGPNPAVNVPNVVGMTQAAAAATLTAAGLTMGTVTTESNETVPAGTIIRQNPAAGTLVMPGSAVNIVVSSGPALPQLASILVTPASPTITTSGSQQFTAIGILENGSSQVLTTGAVWGSSNPAVAFVSSTPGLIGSAAAGTVTISANYGGKTGSAVMTVVPKAPNTTPPTAEITSPVDQAVIVTPVPVIGTANDPEFLKYMVEIAPVGETIYTVIAESTTQVTNGTLGTLDPTLLVNGLYNLRLRVIDRGGIMVTTAPIQVQIKREVKVGNFTLAFSDSNIPYACLPVTVTRVYDSRDKKVGDFGVGWRLDLQTLQLHETGTMGTGWAIDLVQKPGPFGIPILTYVLYGTAPHMVSLTLPDGQVEEFDLTPSPSESRSTPIGTLTLTFTPRPGTHGALEPVPAGASYAPSSDTGSTQFIDSNVTIFDPQQYRYTSKDGSVYLIDKTAGVKKVQCSNGMAITVTPGGIRHDSGGGVNFTRDNLGRITSLTDPNGRTQTYTYDANGDLASHTDAGGNDTKFLYNYSHGLIEIRDPRGVAAIRNEYDNDGRLISSTDPLGRKSTFNHDLVARRETVTDRLGQVTVHEYDASGNIIRTTDPLGGVTTRTYDAFGNELTRTDPLGRTTSFEYDSRRNVTKETDALGNTTSYAYNARNQVTRVADPLGRVTTNTYDTSGNLTQSQDALGNTTTYAYDSGGVILPGSGNLLSKTDALGNVTAYGYDNYGRMTKETDALGRVTSYTYDANGNRLTQTMTRSVNGSTETLTTRFEYDANNHLTKTTHPDGSVTRTEYNAIGKQARTIDALGRVTSYEYDALGRLTKTTYPDGTAETSAYDAEGRRIASTNRAGRSTTYAYDALGRLTDTIYADGTGSGTTYDAAGQVVAGTDGNGNTTSYGYDATGRRTRVVDATGAMTSFNYDAAGNQTEVTDANGNTVAFTYDANNRRTQTIYADGTFDTVTYDDLGRQVSKTDQAGKTTQFVYDALGRLLQVTDALGQVTRYGYDEQGNQIEQTDALGRVTRFTYDKMGRRKSRTLPLGMRETMTYDNVGNLVSKTDFNGKTTTYSYDSVHRLLSKTPDPSFGQPAVHFTYTANGQRATMQDAGGTTNYTYDNRDRLITKATPQGTLYYTYDAAGNLASITSGNAGGAQMSYTYDARNRLASITDRYGVTNYSYDPVGNLAGFLYPNGVQTNYTYNALNRLTNVTGTRGGALAGYTYTLGPAGNRTSVTEESGRKADYTYDALYRLTGETVSGDTTGKNGAVGYTYDAVGNRLVRTSTLPGIQAQNFAYDANDRITSESYDSNGNTLVSGTHSYSWDFENKLTSVDFGNVLFVYDGDGNRVARTAGGVTTQFLVDDRNPTGYAQVLEEISGGTVKKTYTYGLKLINQQQTSGVSYYGFDGHGSVRYLTGAAGTVTDTYDYDAFGNMVRQTGTTANVYLYKGEQVDANVGFAYLRARYLLERTGRFLTGDTEEGQTFDPRSLHRYKYAFDDPIQHSDPSGRWTLTEISVTAGLVGFMAAYSYTGDPWKALGFGLLTGAGIAATPVIEAAAGYSVYRLLALGYIFRPRLVALWGGGDAAKNCASSWATSNGYASFETSIIGRLILALPDSPGKAAAIYRYSEMLASGARGEVHVFLDWSSLSLFSYWVWLESPGLWANYNVTRVVVHNVLTGGISILVRTASGIWTIL